MAALIACLCIAHRQVGENGQYNRNQSQTGDISFYFHTSAPCFPRLLLWGMFCPLTHSPTLRSGDAVSPIAKAKKTTEASVKLFKEMSPARERLLHFIGVCTL
jgi:hypothetical protein